MKNTQANWMGMLTFAFCMVATTIFFFVVLFLQPGPVDNAKAAAGLTHEQDVQRKQVWIESTAEAISRGAESYNINCAFCHNGSGQNQILERFKNNQTKFGGTQIDIFKTISKGIPQSGMYRLDHLMESERWDLVHYLRSLNPNLPASSKSDYEKYFNNRLFYEGI